MIPLHVALHPQTQMIQRKTRTSTTIFAYLGRHLPDCLVRIWVCHDAALLDLYRKDPPQRPAATASLQPRSCTCSPFLTEDLLDAAHTPSPCAPGVYWERENVEGKKKRTQIPIHRVSGYKPETFLLDDDERCFQFPLQVRRQIYQLGTEGSSDERLHSFSSRSTPSEASSALIPIRGLSMRTGPAGMKL